LEHGQVDVGVVEEEEVEEEAWCGSWWWLMPGAALLLRILASIPPCGASDDASSSSANDDGRGRSQVLVVGVAALVRSGRNDLEGTLPMGPYSGKKRQRRTCSTFPVFVLRC